MKKIESIKSELSKLKDGESFAAQMDVLDLRKAISELNLDDREFYFNVGKARTRVTCQFVSKAIKIERMIVTVTLCTIVFVLAAIAVTGLT